MRPDLPQLKSALACAAEKIAVFPVWGVSGSKCNCRNPKCPHPGKHPQGKLVKHGFQDASTDPEVIKSWSQADPTANFGIATGDISEILVLDVDLRSGGFESLVQLEKRHGRLPVTVKVRTGGGGLHIYFALPRSARRLKSMLLVEGVELKANKGCVNAPYCLHASGKRYIVNGRGGLTRRRLAEAPKWLIELATRGLKTTEYVGDQEVDSFVNEGERNTTLFGLATRMRRAGVTSSAIIAGLLEQNRQRCRPPLSEDEVRSIAHNASKEDGPADSRDSIAARLVLLAANAKYFHNSNREAFAVLRIRDHNECWPLTSSVFKDWLRGQYWTTYHAAANSTALDDAMAVLRCKAVFDGAEEPVAIRVAVHGECIWVDLGDSEWKSVRISATEWTIVADDCPIHFVRPPGSQPMPIPVRGGHIGEIRNFLNLTDDTDWALVLGWIVAAFWPGGPCPLLIVNGEQGSAKTTFCRVLKALIDPAFPDSRSQPRDERDLIIAASNGWLLCFDNLSSISSVLSDALCRLVSGSGFGTRQLYSDDAEKLFFARRPIMVNGIEELAGRADLLDRSITITLPTIQAARRKSESVFWKSFDAAHPRILGAFFSALSAGLKNIDAIKLPILPRMADFARWVSAVEPGLGLSRGSILTAYEQSRGNASNAALEASAIGAPILKLLEMKGRWQGTATALLEELDCLVGDITLRRHDWPRTPRALAGAVRRIEPSLRRCGIEVNFRGKTGHAGVRLMVLEMVGESPPPPPASPA